MKINVFVHIFDQVQNYMYGKICTSAIIERQMHGRRLFAFCRMFDFSPKMEGGFKLMWKKMFMNLFYFFTLFKGNE